LGKIGHMKGLFSLLISFYLMVAPVLAQTTGNSKNKPPTTEEQIQKKYTPGQVEDKTGYKDKTQHEDGFGAYQQQALALSTSILGSKIIDQCFKTKVVPSMAVFMAGSLAHIMSEVTGGKDQNSNHKKSQENLFEIENLLKSQGGEVQEALIRKRLEEEKQTLEMLQKRKSWMTAVLAMYGTATALAIAEEVGGLAAAKSAGTATCVPIAQGLSTAFCSPKDLPSMCRFSMYMAQCTGYMPTGQRTTYPNFANPGAYQLSMAPCGGVFGPACISYTNAYHKIAWAMCQPSAPTGLAGFFTIKNMLIGAYSMLLLRTSGTPTTSYIALILSLIDYFVPFLSQAAVASYNYPIPRTVTFGISTKLVHGVIGVINSRMETAKTNIEKLQRVYSAFRQDTDDTSVLGTDQPKEKAPEKEVPDNYELAYAKTGSSAAKTVSSKVEPKSCFSQENKDKDMVYSPSACANPLQIPRLSAGSVTNPVLNKAQALTMDFAQAQANGDTEKASVLGSELSSMAASIQVETDKLLAERDALRKELNQEGQSEGPDMNQIMKDHLAKFEKDMIEGAKTKNINLAGLKLDGTIMPKASLAASATASSEAPKKEAEIKAPAQPVAVTETKAEAVKDTFGILTEDGVEGLIGDESKISEDNPYGLSAEGLRAARANGYYELDEKLRTYGHSKERGVSALQEVSIFKQVSTRYFMNYSRFFDKKKSLPADASSQAKSAAQ
jgi:hypothetical protein